MRKEKEEALRILEALSAVDEELLARCEEQPEKKVIPLWKRGRLWAACLGLLAVGALSWNALRFAGVSKDSLYEATQDENAAIDQIALQTAPTERADGAGLTGAAQETGADTGEAEDAAPEEAGEAVTEGKEDLSVQSDQQERCGIDAQGREVTEEEVRNWMPLGARIPKNLPSGYVFESARIDEQERQATVCWSRGMDSIRITVSQVEEAAVDTVDIDKPETYDERLYEIPFAETVPAEYFEVFQDPVFDINDMTGDMGSVGLELVKSRVLPHEDAGDTDTPRGMFSVLYPDGSDSVLLRFNGRGTPEEIWNMIYSMVR